MSEGKRVSLQSIGPAKKDKKCKPTTTTIRLNLTLPACNSSSFADFNYNTLILNEKRKKEKNREKEEKVNGGPTLDPYASDDEHDLRQIARSFESKYGTPKKKCRRLEDYSELGTGYDENDSFIDNTDAYDEVVPEDQTPELDGFYINKGQLVLKRVDGRSSSDQSDSDDSDVPQNSRSQKRQLSSESGSSSSGSSSSDDSDDSDDSEDSEEEEDEGNEDTEMDIDDSGKEVKNSPKEAKDDRSNGHVVSPVAKKLKLVENSSKKAKSKAITGLFLKKAVSEKEHNEKRHKIDASEKEPSVKRHKADLTEPLEKQCKVECEDMKRLSNVDAAIEAVARGEDSKESGIAESKSHSGSSDESDTEDALNATKVNGQFNGITSTPPPLPEELPENVLSVVLALKELAVKNSNLGKQQFFTSEANSLLLRFEKFMRIVPRDKKGGVYDHLEHFLPCRKETLQKRGKALLLESVEEAFKEPLAKLKGGIDVVMPSAVDRYNLMCKKYERESSADQADPSKPSPEKTKIPRRRFPWTEDLKNLLCIAVKKRRVYYGTVKQKEESWESHLRDFLKVEVLPMWQFGWMKVNSLLEIISKISPDLLQFKPMIPGSKKTLPGPSSKKQVPKVKQIADDIVKSDPSIKKSTALLGGTSVNSKPLQIINHQSQNNSGLVTLNESGAKSSQSLSSGSLTVPSNVPIVNSLQSTNLPQVSQSSSLDQLDGEILKCIRTSLANMVSVTPVQSSVAHPPSNQTKAVNLDNGHKMRNAPATSAPIKKSLNSSVEVMNHIINLQTNGMDASVELIHKKHSQAQSSPVPSGQASSNSLQSYSGDLQDLSKTQSSKVQSSSSSTYVSSSQPLQLTSQQSTASSNSIKVSSVSAINLKLSGLQSQPTSSKAVLTQSMKAHNQQNVPAPSGSVHQAVSSYSSQSVISRGLESSSLGVSSSLTITPVKPSSNSNSYYHQTKSSGHSSIQALASSSIVSQGNSNIRSEVIVTPSSSSSMPHIKSTNVNFSVSGTNSVSSNNYSTSHSSGNNFSTSQSSSGNNFSNSRGVSGNSYQNSLGASGNGFSSPLSNPDISVRTHRPQVHSEPPSLKNSSTDRINFVQPSRNQVPEKSPYMSSNIWPSAVSVDIPRSSSSSPSSVKSITPSPEKAMVSRKDRILQDSRDRGGIDPPMPTLSGPYRSNTASSDQSGAMRNQPQAKTTPQSRNWDDELFVIEDFLKMSTPSSTIPQNTPKVSTASMDSYKHTLPVLEPQRCDNVPNKSSHLDPSRGKNFTVPTTSEHQRVNVVMHNPHVHSSHKSISTGYTQHSRDQSRTKSITSNHSVRDMQRPSPSKSSSSNADSQRENVVMATPHFQESLSDILAGIPAQMISRTDHYTITNSMQNHNLKKKGLPELSDVDLDMAIGTAIPSASSVSNRVDTKSLGKQDESLQKAQELAMRGILMSRTNCDGGNYMEEPWGASMKKNVSNKSSNDISDQRLSGMGTLSSSLSMSELDGMGLGLPSHLVGFQNDYQRHLYGGSSKTTGPNDHRPL